MAFSNPELAVSILFQATTGRPIVLSKGIGDAWLLQCNGFHFIQDPTNMQEVAVVERVVDELADAGYLRAEEWAGANRRIFLTDSGYEFCRRVRPGGAIPPVLHSRAGRRLSRRLRRSQRRSVIFAVLSTGSWHPGRFLEATWHALVCRADCRPGANLILWQIMEYCAPCSVSMHGRLHGSLGESQPRGRAFGVVGLYRRRWRRRREPIIPGSNRSWEVSA
jgi:hypothetical protein